RTCGLARYSTPCGPGRARRHGARCAMTVQTPGPFRTADVPLADPYPLYRHYREHDPVHRADDTWYLFRHDDVAHVLTGRGYGREALPSRIPGTCPHLKRTASHWM